MVAVTGRISAFTRGMRALGCQEPPDTFVLTGQLFRRTRIVKHDFWAATAFYQALDGTRVVAKINRSEPFLGLPMDWIGRWLCRREIRFYRAMADLEHVPALLGRIGRTGFIHAFVEGEPLSASSRIPDSFFPELQKLFAEIHRRGIAYVDANKPQNILLGRDGRPYLIDFQISYDLHELGDWFLNRAILRRMQREDDYHVLKHKRKLRPDQMTNEELQRVSRRSPFIRLHRFLTRPYFLIRRRVMRGLRDAGQLLPEGSK
ncbi:MAG: hypothetical protein NZ561_03170 [Phycisphaerae bacterium]|nr:hypothetical protein [Phycisphaerae bacterium]